MATSTDLHRPRADDFRPLEQDAFRERAQRIPMEAARSWAALARKAGRNPNGSQAAPCEYHLEAQPKPRPANVTISDTTQSHDAYDAEERALALLAAVDLRAMDGHVRTLRDIEADVILQAFRAYGGCVSETARRLGVGRTTLYRKLECLGVPVPPRR